MAGGSETNGGIKAEEYHQKALSGVCHACLASSMIFALVNREGKKADKME